MKKSESFKLLLDYFIDIGRVPSKKEYIALGNNAPIPHKTLRRVFGQNADYFTIIKHMKKTYSAQWYQVEPKPTIKKREEPIEAPKVGISPLEKLRTSKGVSIE
jgi:hypothetical protein